MAGRSCNINRVRSGLNPSKKHSVVKILYSNEDSSEMNSDDFWSYLRFEWEGRIIISSGNSSRYKSKSKRFISKKEIYQLAKSYHKLKYCKAELWDDGVIEVHFSSDIFFKKETLEDKKIGEIVA